MMNEVGAPLRDASRLSARCATPASPALFVDRAADLDRAGSATPAARCFGANTAAAYARLMSHTPAVEIRRRARRRRTDRRSPAPAGTTSIVAVQVHERPRPAAARRDHVHARMARGVLGTRPSAANVLDREPAPLEGRRKKMRTRVYCCPAG